MAANAGETKVKLWEGICYPENMLDDWQEEIDDILQVPFAYAIHDIDHDQKSKQRKTHLAPRSARMTTRALKRDLAALEKDMSPVTLASEARDATRASNARRGNVPQRDRGQSR